MTRFTTTSPSRCIALWSALLSGFLGCGAANSLDVRGQVRYGSEPIRDGVITFKSETGRYAAARISDGAYAVEDSSALDPGTYTVSITAKREAGTRTMTQTTLAHNAGDVVPIIEQFIPSQYNEASTLRVTLESTKSDYDFDLTPAGIK